MAVQVILFILATILFSIIGWQARRSGDLAAQYQRLLQWWGLALGAFVGYTLLSYRFIADTLAADPTAVALGGSAQTRGLLAVALSLAAGVVLWLLVYSQRLRLALCRLFPAPTAPEWDETTRPWPRQRRGFDPQSPIHAVALGLALLLFLQTLVEFILAGGQAGLTPEDLSQNELVLSSGLTALMLLTVTLVGAGLGQDRSWRATLTRLGLRWPTVNELAIGVGIGGLLIAFQYVAGFVWQALTPESIFQQQTELVQAIAGGVTSMGAALLVATFSAVGEEVAFRGGLQPVIGLWPTAILFALTHLQYQFTPATLIILVVGLALGWARQHFGTVAAITTHFTYNFTLLALAVLASQLPTG